jgi:uncharacterized protein YkwD
MARRVVLFIFFVIWVGAVLVVAGGAGTPARASAEPAEAKAAKPSFADDLAFCVDEINRYRKKAGKAPLQRSAELEAFAAEGAAYDARIRKPHEHFGRVPYPHGYSEMGENVIPWWPAKQYGSVKDVIRAGTQGMWSEGPGGGHYENLVGNFMQVGCGIHVANGEITVTQDFLKPPDPRK